MQRKEYRVERIVSMEWSSACARGCNEREEDSGWKDWWRNGTYEIVCRRKGGTAGQNGMGEMYPMRERIPWM